MQRAETHEGDDNTALGPKGRGLKTYAILVYGHVEIMLPYQGAKIKILIWSDCVALMECHLGNHSEKITSICRFYFKIQHFALAQQHSHAFKK